MTKQCNACKETLNHTLFSRWNRYRDQRKHVCVVCSNSGVHEDDIHGYAKDPAWVEAFRACLGAKPGGDRGGDRERQGRER